MDTDPLHNAKKTILRSRSDVEALGVADEASLLACGLPGRHGMPPFAVTPFIVESAIARGGSFGTDDPVAIQFLPSENELKTLEYEQGDPLSERTFAEAPRLVRQYPSRALVRASTECMAYCRFCYRRSLMRQAQGFISDDELERTCAALGRMDGLREILVSGGDPLAASDGKVLGLLSALRKAVPAATLRICTRTPIVSPERITAALVDMVKKNGPAWFIVHVNHPAELVFRTETAIRSILEAGLPVATQSVLLRGVNDDPEVLQELFGRIVALGAKPYYLFQGDLAAGTSHFRVPLSRGLEIYAELRRRLSGLELPRYAVDVPGGLGKAYLPEDIVGRTDGGWRLRSASGAVGEYPEES